MSSWLTRLKQGLKKTSSNLTNAFDFLRFKKWDAETLESLEEALIMADVGVKTTTALLAELKKNASLKGQEDQALQSYLLEKITALLKPLELSYDLPLNVEEKKPYVILMVGMNGSGKTTTIGKLAYQWAQQGQKVMVVAGDTFRAAAVEQLEIWAARGNVTLIKGERDPASLVYDAYKQAQGYDILLIDTAGRLHNNTALMAELQKIYRVLQKIDPALPHSRTVVVDATIGQNALSQIEHFKKIVDLNGIIITKLDGTAKGGILLNIASTYNLPIHYVGVGEKVEDLGPFKAEAFAAGLISTE
jgi:fused signal recognition particle receptor